MDKPSDTIPKTKRCTDCGEIKSVAEFNKSHKAQDGLQIRCKPCNRAGVLEWQKKHPDKVNAKNREWKHGHVGSVREYNRQYRETHGDERRAYARVRWNRLSQQQKQKIWRRDDLRRKYGITVEEYDAKLIAQAGRCAICGDPVTQRRALAVDHCHETEENRGLLCGHCNPLLHKLETFPGWIEAAANYLDKYKS